MSGSHLPVPGYRRHRSRSPGRAEARPRPRPGSHRIAAGSPAVSQNSVTRLPSTLVMEATEDRSARESHGSGRAVGMPWPVRRFVPQRLVGPGGVVVFDVFLQAVPEVALAQHKDVVETVPPKGADDALRDGVRFGGPHRGQHRRDPHGGRSAHEIAAVAAVPVPNEKTRPRASLRESAARHRPGSDGGSHPMHQAPTLMADHHEDVEGAERQRLHGEKSAAQIPAACRRRKVRHPGEGRRPRDTAAPSPG
jgi:hypothetical protein